MLRSGVHTEQDGAGVANETISPGGDDDGTAKTDDRVHPRPAKEATKKQPDDDQHRNPRIRQDMNDGGAHVVVARRCTVCVLVISEVAKCSARRSVVRVCAVFGVTGMGMAVIVTVAMTAHH